MNILRAGHGVFYCARLFVANFPTEVASSTMFGVQSRFYKVHDHLVRRCRDCYFDRRDGRLYVECKTHKRHKQAQKMNPHKEPWKYKRLVWKSVCW
ncbi:unnamed protein product [Trichobilharzia regenti]|nr:unnamed protein product [Trichobilharzia regenti]